MSIRIPQYHANLATATGILSPRGKPNLVLVGEGRNDDGSQKHPKLVLPGGRIEWADTEKARKLENTTGYDRHHA